MVEVLFYIFTALQVVDAVSTWVIIVKAKGRELNRIINFMFTKIGVVPTLVLTKLGVVVSALWMCRVSPDTYASVVMAILIALYVFVAHNNISEIKKAA